MPGAIFRRTPSIGDALIYVEPLQRLFSMGHGGYDGEYFPWVMGHMTSYDGIVRPMTHGE